MSRKRITAKKIEAADASFGQSANNYWRDKAKDAIMGALDDVSKALMDQAQEVANEEAAQLGVQPADYDGAPVAPAAEVVAVEECTECAEEEPKEEVKMAMVFEPRKKEASESKEEKVFEPREKIAGAPVDPTAIGKENWFQVQEKFPQYTKQQKLTMLAVAPTRRNMEAVQAVTETLDGIASKLEENGDADSATQLDVISDLLTASVQECKKIASSNK